MNDKPAEHDPTFTLEAHIAEARARYGEKRWAEMLREWDDPDIPPVGFTVEEWKRTREERE